MRKVLFVCIGLALGALNRSLAGALAGGALGLVFAILLDIRARMLQYDAALTDLYREIEALKAGGALQTQSETSVEAASLVMPHEAAGEPPRSSSAEQESVSLAEMDLAPPPEAPALRSIPTQAAVASEAPMVDEPAFEPAGARIFAAARDWLFGGNTVVRVGVVVLFFGLAFLVKFAAEHAVLPIEYRYLGIGLGTLAMLGLGWRLREQRPAYAMALQGLAVASLYLITFAAFRLHALLPGGLTLAVLVGTCVLSAALAILQNARSLAVIGICGGFLAPVLTSTGGGSHVALFSYYALLNAGIFGIAWFKAWRPLNVLGFLLTFGIGSLWGSQNYRDELFATTEPFLLLFFFLYLGISLLYSRRRKAELSTAISLQVAGERIDYVDGTLVFGTPLVAFGLQYLMVRDMAYGSALSALGLGLIYVPLATLLYRRDREASRLLVESFLGLGVIFASLAIPLGLDAQWTSASWAAEGAGIFWLGLRQHRRVARAFALLLQAGAGISFISVLGSAGAENWLGLRPVFDGPLLSALFLGAAGVGTALLLRRHRDRVGAAETAIEPLAMVWGLAFLNLIFPLWLDMQWSGVAWAAAGLVTLVLATRHDLGAAQGFAILQQGLGGAAFALATASHHSPLPVFNTL
jgi:uncharacterized membrane protein